jgi:hypothetical protein
MWMAKDGTSCKYDTYISHLKLKGESSICYSQPVHKLVQISYDLDPMELCEENILGLVIEQCKIYETKQRRINIQK